MKAILPSGLLQIRSSLLFVGCLCGILHGVTAGTIKLNDEDWRIWQVDPLEQQSLDTLVWDSPKDTVLSLLNCMLLAVHHPKQSTIHHILLLPTDTLEISLQTLHLTGRSRIIFDQSQALQRHFRQLSLRPLSDSALLNRWSTIEQQLAQLSALLPHCPIATRWHYDLTLRATFHLLLALSKRLWQNQPTGQIDGDSVFHHRINNLPPTVWQTQRGLHVLQQYLTFRQWQQYRQHPDSVVNLFDLAMAQSIPEFLKPPLMFAALRKAIQKTTIDRAKFTQMQQFYTRILSRSHDSAFIAKVQHFWQHFSLLRPGNPIPDTKLLTPSGHYQALHHHKGKASLLVFWGSWCAPCLQSIPTLITLYQRSDTTRFQLIWIALESPESVSRWRALIQQRQLPGLHFAALNQFTHPWIQQLNINSIPHYILLNSQFQFVLSMIPILTPNPTLENALQQYRRN